VHDTASRAAGQADPAARRRPSEPDSAAGITRYVASRTKIELAHAAQGSEARRRGAVIRRAVCLGGLAALAVLLWGGYDRRWAWTGVHGHSNLWDWLELVLTPLAAAVVPIWLLRRRALSRRTHLVLGAAAAAFCGLVVAGYAFDLEWTGFPGNKLWDWLELLVLPLALAAWPLWAKLRRKPNPRELAALAAVALGFAIIVVLGYTLDWHWTGFRGNTFWDWLHLFLLPILVPTVVVPAALAALAAAAETGSLGATDATRGRSVPPTIGPPRASP
jgi:hypothetical protein